MRFVHAMYLRETNKTKKEETKWIPYTRQRNERRYIKRSRGCRTKTIIRGNTPTMTNAVKMIDSEDLYKYSRILSAITLAIAILKSGQFGELGRCLRLKTYWTGEQNVEYEKTRRHMRRVIFIFDALLATIIAASLYYCNGYHQNFHIIINMNI